MDFRDGPREVAAEHLKSVADFNGVVVITLNMKTGKSTNWWHFAGHPDWWTAKDLSSVAQQLTASTAEALKTDANSGERKVEVQQPVMVKAKLAPSKTFANLFAIGFAKRNNPTKRVWFEIWICWWQFGLSLRWTEGFWLNVGPLDIGVRVLEAHG